MSSDDIRRVDDTTVSPAVKKVYSQAIAIALVGNLLLLIVKAIAAQISGSSAIYADMANSASDLAYSVLMMIGLWLSLKPADLSHPHGHERIESVVSVFIGLFMGLAGYEALRNGLAAWQARPAQPLASWLLLVPAATAAVKAGMYWRVRVLGARVASPAIAASAKDHLADILTAGVVFIGIGAARFSLQGADPIAGVMVSGWIFYQAGSVVHEGVGQLIGKAASPELEREIIARIQAVPGIVAIDQVIVEHVGPGVRADIHVYVDGEMTLSDAHHLSHAVREAVQTLATIDHAFVHVEPVDGGSQDQGTVQ